MCLCVYIIIITFIFIFYFFFYHIQGGLFLFQIAKVVRVARGSGDKTFGPHCVCACITTLIDCARIYVYTHMYVYVYNVRAYIHTQSRRVVTCLSYKDYKEMVTIFFFCKNIIYSLYFSPTTTEKWSCTFI